MDAKVPLTHPDIAGLAIVQLIVARLQDKGIFTATECRELYLDSAKAVSGMHPLGQEPSESIKATVNHLKWLAYSVDVPGDARE